MSDEYQPDEIVESQSEAEPMPAEPQASAEVPAEPAAGGPVEIAGEGTGREVSESQGDTDTFAAGDSAEVGQGLEPVISGGEAPREEVEVPVVAAAETEAARVDEGEGSLAPDTARVVSIVNLESTKGADAGEKRSPLASVGAMLAGRGWIVGAVLAVLLILFLFLPPISLAQRVSLGGGYTALDSSTPSVEHPDGLRVTRVDKTEERVRIKLGSVPRADFVAGSVSESLNGAVEAVPDYLEPKSPYYTIDLKSSEPVPGVMDVVVPNESEPWETLDLYAWDGQTWRWLPTRLDREREVLISEVDALPPSVMVMQSRAATQRIVAEAERWPVPVDATISELDVSGMLIGTLGGLTGDASQLPAASEGGGVALAPTVRNWLPGRAPNWALVSDMVTMDADRQAHVTNLLAVAQDGGYPGLVVDYRQVQPQDRDAYTQFIRELGAAFHEAGLWLAVVVDTPQRAADGSWDTGGYDWRALGAAADQLRVIMPLTPEAYAPGGEAEQLVQWAVTQVERHRLLPIYSTLSTDGEQPVSLETVLAAVGEVRARETLTESIKPGTPLNLSLGEGVVTHNDPDIDALHVTVGGTTYCLGTSRWLAARMVLPARYQLGGIVLRDVFGEGNVPGLASEIAFLQPGEVNGAHTVPEVVWEVTNPQGRTSEATTTLAQPEFAWTAPDITGTYRIAARVGGLGKGALEILVAEPTPVITETVAGGEEELGVTAGEEEEGEEEAEPGLRAAYVADVTVPDNTRFEKGETFTKTWRLRNAGTQDWPEDTVLAFTSGAQLSEMNEVKVGAVEVGDSIDVSVEMVAPEEDGSYRSTWSLRTEGQVIGGGSVYVLIRVGEEQPAAEQPVAPRPVASGGFELGGHIRDMSIPYRDQMRYAGMTWVKTQVFFGQSANSAIQTAHANGFKIQLSAIGGPNMVVEPGFEDRFASWVAGLAAAGADAIEVWNEPNIDREWKVGHISPQAYTNLLCKSYHAIKAANPSTEVISAAPSPTGWFGGACTPNGCDDLPWMQGLYNAGAANCMDYIGAHHNGGATSPSARIGHPANPSDTHHSWFFLPQTELYYNTFGGSRKLFYTEMGYASQEGVPAFSSQFAWASGTDNAQQAAWLAEAVRLSINTGMVSRIIVWNIDFVRYGYDPQDGYAIIRPGGSCPACESLHAVLGSR